MKKTMLSVLVFLGSTLHAQAPLEIGVVEGQPLGANIKRLIQSLDYLGRPLDQRVTSRLSVATKNRDATQLQKLLDPHVLCVVSINPELRVKVTRGPASAALQQGGFTPVIVKVLNQGTVTNRLRIVTPQSGPVYAGAALAILERQAQTELNENENTKNDPERFLSVEMFGQPPMTSNLSGLEVEYALGLIYCSESGKREATLGFDIGAGNQDIGFRGEVPILFDVRPAIPVELSILDDNGKPTAARLTIRDKLGHVYPPQAKRLAPDFFFQPQIYRQDSDMVLLPPGEFTVQYSRGPEYETLTQQIDVSQESAKLNLRMKRWINPMDFGFYCGDHHIHGAGCSHYTSPTEGVTPEDMFVQVKGEGLNVGCVLTWGPCFDHQRQYFSPIAAKISEPFSLIKYDLEISGFGSAAMGHVCLLNLKNQTYPGSDESKEKGWPTWTVPVLRWTKEQGGFTGFPHSAFDIDAPVAAGDLISLLDMNGDQRLDKTEADHDLLPEEFATIDEDGDLQLTKKELTRSANRAADVLPNVVLPDMNGGGALEICVSAAEGVCDFISAMDTPRTSELNIWYHIMNSGIPLKLSGETDFPCMSSRRVGQGRVYVQMGNIERIDFAKWCQGLAEGRSYVSDGFAHALEFSVNGKLPGTTDVTLGESGTVKVAAKVSFSKQTPEGVAYGNVEPESGRIMIGDTVNLHRPRSDKVIEGGTRTVDLVVNGELVESANVPADGKVHDLEFQLEVNESSWIALRHFPQLHTNPVRVLIGGKPIRASRKSAMWCAESIRLLWKNRSHLISEDERDAAEAAYQRAIAKYENAADEAIR